MTSVNLHHCITSVENSPGITAGTVQLVCVIVHPMLFKCFSGGVCIIQGSDLPEAMQVLLHMLGMSVHVFFSQSLELSGHFCTMSEDTIIQMCCQPARRCPGVCETLEQSADYF